MTAANDKRITDLKVGDTESFERTISARDVADFIRLSGDTNPLHHDEIYAAATKFKKPIVHGMFLGALCSTLVGVYLPGKRCLYLGQNLLFKQPVFIDDTVTVSGTVAHISLATRCIDINIEIKSHGIVVAAGVAKVHMLE